LGEKKSRRARTRGRRRGHHKVKRTKKPVFSNKPQGSTYSKGKASLAGSIEKKSHGVTERKKLTGVNLEKKKPDKARQKSEYHG